jgi:hypothetical protein
MLLMLQRKRKQPHVEDCSITFNNHHFFTFTRYFYESSELINYFVSSNPVMMSPEKFIF